MGAERRPRGHRRHRDAAVKRKFSMWSETPSCPPPSRGRNPVELTCPTSRPPSQRRVCGLIVRFAPHSPSPWKGEDRTGSLSTSAAHEADIGTRPAHALSSLSHVALSLFDAATRLTHARSHALIESESTSSTRSPAAKCVATRSQRVDEMHMRDSTLHRIARPLSRARNPLRGRRIRASRRARQR